MGARDSMRYDVEQRQKETWKHGNFRDDEKRAEWERARE